MNNEQFTKLEQIKKQALKISNEPLTLYNHISLLWQNTDELTVVIKGDNNETFFNGIPPCVGMSLTTLSQNGEGDPTTCLSTPAGQSIQEWGRNCISTNATCFIKLTRRSNGAVFSSVETTEVVIWDLKTAPDITFSSEKLDKESNMVTRVKATIGGSCSYDTWERKLLEPWV